MATIRLTDAAWFAREYGRVKAVLTYNLTRDGIDASELARALRNYLLVDYTSAELLAFRDALVAEGLIEVV